MEHDTRFYVSNELLRKLLLYPVDHYAIETMKLSEAKSSMKGYSTVNITSNTLKDTLKDTKYALLPVFMVNVKYKNKYYLFGMNGQTGEFVGNMPVDKLKAVIYTLSIFIIVMGLVILISYLIGGRV